MTTLRTAAQQALDTLLKSHTCPLMPDDCEDAITALRAALAEPNICTWHGDEEGTYETSCKHLFQVIDGTPDENGFKNCCFCGLWLESHPWEDGDDE